jgi:hypothetical protein
VTFFKNFAIKEDMRFQFRAGFFNIFNEAFANPDQGDMGNFTINTLNALNPATGQCFFIPPELPMEMVR